MPSVDSPSDSEDSGSPLFLATLLLLFLTLEESSSVDVANVFIESLRDPLESE